MKKMEEIKNHVFCGNCLDVMAEFPDNSIDSIVTDPPYGLKFMGKKWDHGVPGIPFWEEALRVVKPGAHMLAFGGTRTYHRVTTAIEDAGWEIRDCMMWIYGSGWPKSHDVKKAIEKDTPEEAEEWDGWGTALKPAYEPIVIARKPLDGTIAQNVLTWGCGGINIDGCRIPFPADDNALEEGIKRAAKPRVDFRNGHFHAGADCSKTNIVETSMTPLGRWPANIILDEEAGRLLDEQSGYDCGNKAPVSPGIRGKSKGVYGDYAQKGCNPLTFRGDTGGASRFFYCAKASRKERGEGKDHPIVKPLALIQYLIRLITPPKGITLDMFAGSGTHAEAALNENVKYVCIELLPENTKKIENRIKHHKMVNKLDIIENSEGATIIKCMSEIQTGILDYGGEKA